MICTCFYRGQGLGNQLWAWAATRSLANRNGYDWGIQAPWRFKGNGFLKIDFGKNVLGFAPKAPTDKLPIRIKNYYKEPLKIHKELKFDISLPDPYFFSIEDNTKIDGVLQSVSYIKENKSEYSNLLRVANPGVSTSTCIIHVRGGDFKGTKEVLLPEAYYRDSINVIREIEPSALFKVITNDPKYAKSILPEIEIVSSYKDEEVYSGPDGIIDKRVAKDFALLQHAKYLILNNSSFSWWGAWTNVGAACIIAPKYWARYNLHGPFWSTGGIIVESWKYLSPQGVLEDGNECQIEYLEFTKSDDFKYSYN